MPQCAVATCRNSHRRTRGRRIRYHRFPQIPEVRSRWVCACGRVPLPNGEIPFNIQTARICSLHFTNESYEKDMEHLVLGLPVRSRLRRGAVPTVGVPVSVEPVTRMLVEDAKRSLLKVAHAKILNGQKVVTNTDTTTSTTTSNGSDGTKMPKGRLKQQQTRAGGSRAANNSQQPRPGGSQQQQQQQPKASGSQQSRNSQPKLTNRQVQQQQKRIHTQRQIQIQQRIQQQQQQQQQQQANNHLKGQKGQNSFILEEENNLNHEVNVLLALGLQPRLNKMHAMDENSSVVANTKNMKATEKKEDDDFSRQSPQVPQNQQNGAALPEETVTAATERLHSSTVKEEPLQDTITDLSKKSSTDLTSLTKHVEDTKIIRSDERASRKRRSTDEIPSANGNANTKRICLEQREQLVSSLITGYENASADELATRADCLRAELQALDELARAAEMEWNRVLTMRKLKEEAYLRVERRRQVVNFMEGHDRLNDLLPSMNSAHDSHDWEAKKLGNIKEKCAFPTVRVGGGGDDEQNILYKSNNSDKISKSLQQTAQNLSNRLSADARKQAADLMAENRQIGEGRQGPTVDVRSIIADYRLRHPESVPRRGRRMRNSVNVNLGAGGAVMENNQNTDSRPSSTDSCKSNSNVEGNNSLNFKDVLVHFAKLSQQQGEALKTPQNYPDVTLHPVAPSPPTTQNSTPQPSGSLLHGILTKAQSPRPTTFSPTLARLLTAPERERSAPVTTVTPHSNSASQRMIQAYQEANPVSISELLSSSKGRTEITITPVVNALVPSHANNMMQVDDEEESSIMEERESRISGGSRDDRDISPRCQGCHERAAQYVCAGCGNQWYCSPECQAAAWDEHSEVCSG